MVVSCCYYWLVDGSQLLLLPPTVDWLMVVSCCYYWLVDGDGSQLLLQLAGWLAAYDPIGPPLSRGAAMFPPIND